MSVSAFLTREILRRAHPHVHGRSQFNDAGNEITMVNGHQAEPPAKASEYSDSSVGEAKSKSGV